MASSDPWKRYLDAGFELTQLTRQRAEKVVRDLMKAGEVQRDEAQDRVEELLERSRRMTDSVVEIVRAEVTKQLSALGLAARAKPAPKPSPAKQAAAPAKKAAAPAKKAAKTVTKKTATAVKKAAPAAKKKATGKS